MNAKPLLSLLLFVLLQVNVVASVAEGREAEVPIGPTHDMAMDQAMASEHEDCHDQESDSVSHDLFRCSSHCMGGVSLIQDPLQLPERELIRVVFAAERKSPLIGFLNPPYHPPDTHS